MILIIIKIKKLMIRMIKLTLIIRQVQISWNKNFLIKYNNKKMILIKIILKKSKLTICYIHNSIYKKVKMKNSKQFF